MGGLEISSEQLAQISEHAVVDLPRECCGVLLGRHAAAGARVERVVAAANVAPRPTSGFEIAPGDLAAAQRRGRADGLEIVGYYHSHPSGEAIPSRRDRDAAWPGTSYMIGATTDETVSEWRSWHLGPNGRFVEQAVLVTERTV